MGYVQANVRNRKKRVGEKEYLDKSDTLTNRQEKKREKQQEVSAARPPQIGKEGYSKQHKAHDYNEQVQQIIADKKREDRVAKPPVFLPIPSELAIKLYPSSPIAPLWH